MSIKKIRNKVVLLLLGLIAIAIGMIFPMAVSASEVDVTYTTYINGAWGPWVSNGATSGPEGTYSIGQNVLNAIQITTPDPNVTLNYYITNPNQNTTLTEGSVAGWSGATMNSIAIWAAGANGNNYDVYYRTNVAGIGWMGWAKNGQRSGYQDGRSISSIQIRVVSKGYFSPMEGVGNQDEEYPLRVYSPPVNLRALSGSAYAPQNWNSTYFNSGYTSNQNFWMIYLNGAYAFCIEPSRPLNSSSTTNGTTYYRISTDFETGGYNSVPHSGTAYQRYQSPDAVRGIQKILYYANVQRENGVPSAGYGGIYGPSLWGHDNGTNAAWDYGWYMSTQAIIWEVIVGERNPLTLRKSGTNVTRNLMLPGASVAGYYNNYYNDLDAKLTSNNNVPSFASQMYASNDEVTHNFSFDKDLVLTDTTGNLSASNLGNIRLMDMRTGMGIGGGEIDVVRQGNTLTLRYLVPLSQLSEKTKNAIINANAANALYIVGTQASLSNGQEQSNMYHVIYNGVQQQSLLQGTYQSIQSFILRLNLQVKVNYNILRDNTVFPATINNNPTEIDNGVYNIRIKSSNKRVDMYGGYQGNGTIVHQWDPNTSLNQQFKIEKVDNTYYKIIAMHSNRVLDVTHTGAEANVIQNRYTGSNTQLWRITINADGAYTIQNKASVLAGNNLVWDVWGGDALNGRAIMQYTSHGGNNQRFYLDKLAAYPVFTGSNTATKITSSQYVNWGASANLASIANLNQAYIFNGWNKTNLGITSFNLTSGAYEINGRFEKKRYPVIFDFDDKGVIAPRNYQQAWCDYVTANNWDDLDYECSRALDEVYWEYMDYINSEFKNVGGVLMYEDGPLYSGDLADYGISGRLSETTLSLISPGLPGQTNDSGTMTNGDVVQAIRHGENALLPEVIPNEPYNHIGWSKSHQDIRGNTFITALYELKKFTVTFDLQQGADLFSGELVQTGVEWGTAAVEPTLITKPGYTFLRWDIGFDNVRSNLTVNAIYEYHEEYTEPYFTSYVRVQTDYSYVYEPFSPLGKLLFRNGIVLNKKAYSERPMEIVSRTALHTTLAMKLGQYSPDFTAFLNCGESGKVEDCMWTIERYQ